jgi:hypothetical protein
MGKAHHINAGTRDKDVDKISHVSTANAKPFNQKNIEKHKNRQQKRVVKCKDLRTGFLPPFRFCVWATSCIGTSPSASGVDTDELVDPSGKGSDLGTTESVAVSL